MAQNNFNVNENIVVKNLTGAPVGWIKVNGQGGEINIPPHTSILVDRMEVISKVQSGSILFCGENGDFTHTHLYIDDKPTRVYLGIETEESEQSVISENKIKSAFDCKTQKAFEKAITDLAVTFSEKKMLVDTIKKLGINDYKKIKFVEEYTGMTIED